MGHAPLWTWARLNRALTGPHSLAVAGWNLNRSSGFAFSAQGSYARYLGYLRELLVGTSEAPVLGTPWVPVLGSEALVVDRAGPGPLLYLLQACLVPQILLREGGREGEGGRRRGARGRGKGRGREREREKGRGEESERQGEREGREEREEGRERQGRREGERESKGKVPARYFAVIATGEGHEAR
eukprot:2214252-Rhodomonas_salina.1